MRALRPGATFEADRLLDPADAVARYLETVPVAPPGVERVPLHAAFGRVLAEDAVASEDVPAADRSTMDGFALRTADAGEARRIVGAVRMGEAPPGPVGRGEAMRIPTGGVLPPGADAVVPVEDAVERDGLLFPATTPPAGDCVAPRGGDMRTGDAVLGAGRRIGAAELSVLATLGLAEVPVFRRPLVAVISTGDELVDVADRPRTGQVRDSNRWAIAGGLAALGCDAVHLPRAPDDPDAIRALVADGLARADAVVLTGGSSVGARDHVPAAIDGLGPPGVVVHGLRVKPGKPTVLAAVGARPVIGLPGNPASALTILEAVAAGIFRALTGERGVRTSTVGSIAAAPFAGRSGWTWYVPAVLSADGVRPLQLRSSHTSLLARGDGYVVVGPEPPRIETGDAVTLVRYGG